MDLNTLALHLINKQQEYTKTKKRYTARSVLINFLAIDLFIGHLRLYEIIYPALFVHQTHYQ